MNEKTPNGTPRKSLGLISAALLIAASGATLQAGPIFTLDPANGALQGAPGQTVGWGFTMVSDPTNWTTVVGTILLGESNPGLGIYTDFITGQGGPTFGSLPSGAVDWSQLFTLIPGSGFASYLIDPSAVPGSVNAGSILILYEMYSGNPATCGGACFVSSGTEMLDFSVQVSEVPEPGTVTMLLLGAAGLLGVGWRRRQRP